MLRRKQVWPSHLRRQRVGCKRRKTEMPLPAGIQIEMGVWRFRVSPIGTTCLCLCSGNSLVMTFDECKSTYFQIFLDELSRTYPDTLMVLLLDNAKFHTCKGLIIPQNIKFIFQPPYSPELNPSEKVWWTMKRSFRNKSYKTLDEVEEFIKNETASLTTEAIKQICGYSYFWG